MSSTDMTNSLGGDVAACLAQLDGILTQRMSAIQTEAEEVREHWETVKALRVGIQRKVEELERTYNAACQNTSRISDEYERLAMMRERAERALALKPPELPQAPRRAIRAIRAVPRLKQELLANSSEIRCEKPICGVYFLLEDAEVVYVGQSINVISRLASHVTEGQKQFNRWTYIEVERANLDHVESFYITLLRPRHNKAGVPKLLAQNDPAINGEAA